MSHALTRAQHPPKSSGLPEHWVRRIARQVMSAMAYMHTEAGVVHRDIKLENSLVRLRHAASYTMHLREWREDSSGRTLGAQARDKTEVEVPLRSLGSGSRQACFRQLRLEVVAARAQTTATRCSHSARHRRGPRSGRLAYRIRATPGAPRSTVCLGGPRAAFWILKSRWPISG
ncbi:hypothetical protein BCR44DRAFT_1281224 [Catenaria anguillulae PL171]|uniref:Protein kinase domain-containing protein n=1 Tax=Catenaria anguillulae PL171 TaxID=765915 RepID=A0A1Y2I014_9FUNG|nr:hypothetical protein BCR44DRAFT_1281224 [Catenaria anguillulae PL171]